MNWDLGLRIIWVNGDKGIICEIKNNDNIIIDWINWDPNIPKKVQYTSSMLDECFNDGFIKIDKQYYRNKKIEELGI